MSLDKLTRIPTKMRMSNQLKKIRQRLNLTLLEAAKQAKCDESAISLWENGVREPQRDFRKAYAKMLGISVPKLGEIVYASSARFSDE